MKTHLQLAGLLLVAGTLWAQQEFTDRERAVAEILRVGGKVQRDDKRVGRPVVAVELTGCEITAAGIKYLPALTELQSLDL